MSGFESRQPGGVWHAVNTKAYSYSFVHMDGFGGAMHGCSTGGGIRTANLLHHMPMVLAVPKHEQQAYMGHMGGASFADTLKSIFNGVVNAGRFANETGITGAVGNLINKILPPKVVPGAPKAPMPIEPGNLPGTTPGLNQGEQKRQRFGGTFF